MRLDSEIRDLRAQEASGSSHPRSNPQAQTTQSSETGFLSALSAEEERRVLSDNEQVFRAAISPLVRAQIIQPAFTDLNSQLVSSLQHPFAIGRQRVESVLIAQSDTLKSAKIDMVSIRAQLNTDQAKLNQMRFVMPESDFWWASLPAKGVFFGAQNVSSRSVTGELQRQLSKLKDENSATESRITAMLHETEGKQQRLQADMKGLEEELQRMQDTLTEEAKPFKLVSIQLRDAVLYFPVAIALVYGYLTFEYVILVGRVRRLRDVYVDLGYSPVTLKVYFAPVPGTTTISATVTALLFALPVVVCFGSAHRIQTSATLATAAPATLYLLAEVLLCGCFLGALVCATRVASSFR